MSSLCLRSADMEILSRGSDDKAAKVQPPHSIAPGPNRQTNLPEKTNKYRDTNPKEPVYTGFHLASSHADSSCNLTPCWFPTSTSIFPATSLPRNPSPPATAPACSICREPAAMPTACSAIFQSCCSPATCCSSTTPAYFPPGSMDAARAPVLN